MRNNLLLSLALLCPLSFYACTSEEDLGNHPDNDAGATDPGSNDSGSADATKGTDAANNSDAAVDGSKPDSTSAGDANNTDVVVIPSDGGVSSFGVVKAPNGSNLRWNTIWGSGADNLYFGGTAGAIARWNGTSIVAEPATVSADILLLTGSGPNDIWATASGGNALHSNGTAWTKHLYTAATAIDATNAMGFYATSVANGGARYYTDLRRSTFINTAQTEVGTPAVMVGVSYYGGASIAPLSKDDIWIGTRNTGGSAFAIEHWNGTAWSEYTPISGYFKVEGMHGRISSDVWAVGYNTQPSAGVKCSAVHWDGLAWNPTCTGLPTNALDALLGVYAEAANRVWAVGYKGAYFFNGTSWSEVALPAAATGKTLGAVWVVGGQVWIAGAEGLILRSQ